MHHLHYIQSQETDTQQGMRQMAKRFNQAEQRAYNEAFDVYEAFICGAPLGANPYRVGTGQHAAWGEGLKEARQVERERIAVEVKLARTVGYY